jgi:serine/threonine-protein kinase
VTAATEIRRGTLVDNRYRVQRILGQGGFGRTYLVCDQRRFDEFCVLKEFVPHTTAESLVQRARDLFEREAKVLYELDHPQIPKFLAWLEENGRLFLVQEYVDGKTYSQLLRDRLVFGKPFSEAEVIQWLADILPVLDYLHSCHIIHRDISPDNIMLPSQGDKPMLIDLGVVKQVMSEVRSGSLRSTTNTGYALLVGKVGYSPPEQIDKGQCYPSSDLYALAVSALVLLNGKHPKEQIGSNLWIDPEIAISDRLAQILGKMLADTPRERYQSAKDVLDELQALLPALPSTSVETPSIQSLSLIPAAPENEFVAPTLMQTKTEIQNQPEAEPGRNTQKGLFLSLQAMAIGIFTSMFLFGGLSLSLLSPYITVVCKTLDNCARDREFQEIYSQEVEEGKKALLKVEEAQSLEELQNTRERLNIAIIRLSTIPRDVSVYPEARKVLREYQGYLHQIQIKLTQEDRVEKQLATIDQLSGEATQRSDTANTLPQYQKAKAEWQKVQQRLQSIPSDAFVKDKVQLQLAEANNKIRAIQAEIEQRSVQTEQKIEKVAQQAREQRLALLQSREQPTSPSLEQNSPGVPSATRSPTPSNVNSPVKPPTNNRTAQTSHPTPATEKQQTAIPVNPSPTQPTNNSVPPEEKQATILRINAYVESDRDISIRHANELAYGLAIAGQKGQINYGTRMYRKVQNTIRWLRRGKSVEEATTLSKVPPSIVQQLIAWGQTRPSLRKSESGSSISSD